MAMVELPQRKEPTKFMRKWEHTEGSNYRSISLGYICLVAMAIYLTEELEKRSLFGLQLKGSSPQSSIHWRPEIR